MGQVRTGCEHRHTQPDAAWNRVDHVGRGERSVEFRQDRPIFPDYRHRREQGLLPPSIGTSDCAHIIQGHMYDLVMPRG